MSNNQRVVFVWFVGASAAAAQHKRGARQHYAAALCWIFSAGNILLNKLRNRSGARLYLNKRRRGSVNYYI